ncbi:cysteine proteinase [Coemansia reversa NRRL 1564]|uniref:ubiquitinyl hydrolase 1 n=1 Tax=Coemansia reversa (strain ATCC 12441 / NRRL 1564) TaxID=763665 RepID=A0A2G5B3S4_COERN|nr:cysteine proteinase [Coemansia reversa NRRL 1564]|eukprot:PIA13669.1 cysteine proteinase [Coemansia reversa NRRL 1564]
MNSVLQCIIGTGPLKRYFMRGEWKKKLLMQNRERAEVVIEFSQLLELMWRGQYSYISPSRFRLAIGDCSEQFEGDNQEDAHEFASFLLDVLHESLNHVYPIPPPEREMTPDEEMQFEKLTDRKQASIQWKRYIRRSLSIITSIFQGQIQSRLTCMTCNHTSTTYHTFTELSVPIPEPCNSNNSSGANVGKSGMSFLRKNKQKTEQVLPVNIYQCLDAYSEMEVLDGNDKWMCPRCKTKRKATKQLKVSRLPQVLIVHLKRFSTRGHFREKLETNVHIPTQRLYMENYITPGAHPSAMYNLYAVVNHFGTMSGGHYTASVFDELREQWNYFDDTKVFPISETQVASPAAYLLFFVQERAKVK